LLVGLLASIPTSASGLPDAHLIPPSSFALPGPAVRLLELEEADRVVVGVGEPGGEREPDVGDAVDSAQSGEILDLDALRLELGVLGGDVVYPPGGLGCLVGGAGDALGDDQPAVAPASEGEELLGVEQDLEAEGAAVEPAGYAEVGREQHHIDRVFTEHG